jgi:hypothetical protein
MEASSIDLLSGPPLLGRFGLFGIDIYSSIYTFPSSLPSSLFWQEFSFSSQVTFHPYSQSNVILVAAFGRQI